jgi:hypothetical protein
MISKDGAVINISAFKNINKQMNLSEHLYVLCRFMINYDKISCLVILFNNKKVVHCLK